MLGNKHSKMDSRALGLSLAVFGFVFWLTGLVWHGPIGQPSMMGLMYPGFSFMNMMNSGILLILFPAAGYISGEIIARLYNWFLEKHWP